MPLLKPSEIAALRALAAEPTPDGLLPAHRSAQDLGVEYLALRELDRMGLAEHIFLRQYDPPKRPAWTAPRRERKGSPFRFRITARGRKRLEAIETGRRHRMRLVSGGS